VASKELAQAAQRFSENVLDATNRFELIVGEEGRLAGLPELAREQARQDALQNGHGTEVCPQWRFTQQMPSYLPAMTYLEDDDIRRQLWEGANTIGRANPHDNTSLVWKILRLREKRARLLGKTSFADLVLTRRMAKTSDRALAFVDELFSRVKTTFNRECCALQEFVAEKTGRASEPLEPWAMDYWAEVMRRENFQFDEEELRAYFPIDGVIEGMFQIAEILFSVDIRERAGIEVWHPEVKYYEVYGREGGRLGAFYTDWHPRESKRSGAWMNSLITGGPARGVEGCGERRPHLGLICGNLTPSVGGRVSLLTHREVETIFHEFGHLLHHLFGEVEIRSLNGIHVAWDFVELPSQIMENWCWERESLDLFARHYETGNLIPQELFEKMIRARNFHSATLMMRQLYLGKMDLELHTHFQEFDGQDLDESLNRVLAGFRFPSKTPPPPMVRRFGHLFSSSTGYAAGYYSYKWAEVLDADAFTRFQNEGVLNPQIGREFVEKILSQGNSVDPDQLYRDFMGRRPDIEALLRRAGLST
jgi:oligopeptidase A